MTVQVSQEERFSAFAHAYGDRLFRTALMLTADWHLAEDLTQTTLAKLYSSWKRVEAADNTAAYARGVLVKTWLSHRRKRSNQERPSTIDADHTGPAGRVGDTETPELRMAVLDGLAALEPRDRAVLVLRYFEDRSVEQTARDLGMSVSAVTSATSRALRRARTAFTERGLHLPEFSNGGT